MQCYRFVDENHTGALLGAGEVAAFQHAHPVDAGVGDAVAVQVGSRGVVAVDYSYPGHSYCCGYCAEGCHRPCIHSFKVDGIISMLQNINSMCM